MSSSHEKNTPEEVLTPDDALKVEIGRFFGYAKQLEQLFLRYRGVVPLEHRETFGTLLQECKTRMKFLKDAFVTGLIPMTDAITVLQQSMGFISLKADVSAVTSSVANVIETYLEDKPREALRAVDLMIEALQVELAQQEVTKKPVHMRRVARITQVTKKMGEPVRKNFFETEEQSEEDYLFAFNWMKKHAPMMLSGDEVDESVWAFDAIAQQLHTLITSNRFMEDLTSSKMPLQKVVESTITRMRLDSKATDMGRYNLTEMWVILTDRDREIVFEKLLTLFGLPKGFTTIASAKEGVYTIRSTSGKESYNLNLVERVAELERARPGAAQVMYERFGIRRFNRYPLEILIQQYDERDEEGPYGVALCGDTDTNGSFLMPHEIDVWQKMFKDANKAGRKVRICEASSGITFMTRLLTLDRKYGKKNKIDFLLIRAHGSLWVIGLGPHDDGDLGPKELKNRFDLQRHRDIFSDNATAIFEGCSQGRKGGIAQTFSKLLPGMIVYAPKGIFSTLHELSIENKEGNCVIVPTHIRFDENKIDTPHMYVNGRKRKIADIKKKNVD